MGLQENENVSDLGSSGIPLGSNNNYERIDSNMLAEDYDDASHHHHQKDRSRSTRKYVFACAVFASLNSALLGYGTLFYLVNDVCELFIKSNSSSIVNRLRTPGFASLIHVKISMRGNLSSLVFL